MTRGPTRRFVVLLATASGCNTGGAATPTSTGMDPATAGDGGAAGAGGGMSSMTTVVTGVPCDVAGVRASHCTTRHGRPPSSGAPMPMVTYEDLVAPARSDNARMVVEV